ncbi:hypothetical protein FACS189421_05700 [Bacteroidia bacterium]|nr:hypothetical protein FACS189421_05700 [Bacteroidia bacterium]GHT50198.1 hypothetical protein FACS189440_17200 [Bacteroidia bacterium]
MGLLNELVNIQLILRKHLSNGYLSQKLSIIGLQSEEYNRHPEKYTYRAKRHSIQESIYGVDSDMSAIDIARLRLWLSLVVDEEDFDNIETLPNLDYKIVCGNSLIGFPENWNSPAFERIEKLKDKFFAETDVEIRKTYKMEIDKEIADRLSSSQRIFGYQVNFDFKLFFSEVWREKEGFDIVIGNPPYVRVQNLPHSEIDFYKNHYDFAWKRIDISILFFEKALNIGNKKTTISFISSNQFLTTEYGLKARHYLSKNRNVFKIVDFGSLPIFQNALTYVDIFVLSKQANDSIEYFKINTLPFNISNNFIKIISSELSENIWILESSNEIDILNKIKKDSIPLSSFAKSWAGIITGYDDLLLFNNDKLPDYIESDLLVPVLRAQSCDRYTYANVTKYAFYPYYFENNKTELIPLDRIKAQYPKSYNFIMENENLLKARKDSRITMGDRIGWYGLIRFGTIDKFNETKIVSPGEVKRNKFAIDKSKSAFSCARVFQLILFQIPSIYLNY